MLALMAVKFERMLEIIDDMLILDVGDIEVTLE